MPGLDVMSLCPLGASSLLWRAASGEWTQTVVCKATYDLIPGTCRLAAQQEHPTEDDNHWNDDPARSVYAPSDLAPFKARADVVLVGKAFAPRKQPVRSLVARLSVGEVDKSIEVVVDRSWAPDGQIREGPWFTSMPLRYERAAGGAGTWNPVGMSAERPDAQGQIRLPNLQPVGFAPRDRNTPIAPVGFGPIAAGWPLRTRHLGRLAQSWPDAGWRQRPLPDRLDPLYFNAAPPDQQTAALHADERLSMECLSREHPRLVTQLPGVQPTARAEIVGEGAQDVRLVCDTLWIDTDRGICTLTWRGQIRLRQPETSGRVVISMVEASGRPVANPEPIEEDPGLDRTRTIRTEVPQRNAQGAEPAWLSRGPAAPPAPRPAAGSRPMSMQAPSRPPPAPPPPPAPVAAPPPPAPVAAPPPPPPAPVAAPPPPAPVAAPPPPAPVGPPPPAPVGPPVAAPPVRPVAQPRTVGEVVALGGTVDPVAGARPPPSRPGSAASIGVLAASNAAADPRKADAGPISAPTAAPTVPLPPRAVSGDLVELVWFDPKFASRIRKQPEWRKLLADVKPLPRDEDADPEAAGDRRQARDRRDLSAILRGGEPIGADAIDELVARTLDEGTTPAPLVLLAGELELPFDPVETLKAVVAAASPFAPGDKRLKETLDAVAELLRAPGTDRAGSVAEGLTGRVRDAFVQGFRSLPSGYLESHADRTLLEQRAYQKRSLLGQGFLRGLLTVAAGQPPIPTYLPEGLAQELPMFQRMRVRLVAEARLQLDQYEAHAHALRVVALSRVITRGKRG